MSGFRRSRRERGPRSVTGTLAAMLLACELVVVLLAALALLGLRDLPPGLALGGGGALVVLIAVAAALATRPIGILLGWIVQVVLIATFAVSIPVGLVGLVFTLNKVYSTDQPSLQAAIRATHTPAQLKIAKSKDSIVHGGQIAPGDSACNSCAGNCGSSGLSGYKLVSTYVWQCCFNIFTRIILTESIRVRHYSPPQVMGSFTQVSGPSQRHLASTNACQCCHLALSSSFRPSPQLQCPHNERPRPWPKRSVSQRCVTPAAVKRYVDSEGVLISGEVEIVSLAFICRRDPSMHSQLAT